MKKNSYFDDLKSGILSAIEYEDKKITLKTMSYSLPKSPPQFSKNKIRSLRESMIMSQPVFASLLGVSPAAVKAWEQGEKKPSGTARRLLQILEKDPTVLKQITKTGA